MKKYFVMSDIHSFYNEMITALKLKDFDDKNPDHILVVCGDLFDRGPDTNKVFDFATKLAEEDRLIYIYGNHEELLFDCVDEILNHTGVVSSHHISNGTFDTIVQFTGMNKYDIYGNMFDRKEFIRKIYPLLDFITEKTCDVAEIDDHVFVHGWIPCEPISGSVPKNWDTEDADWDEARWINGMSAWHHGARLPKKTIVCGHWHTSWGHSHLHQDRKEFPDKNRKDWQKSFEIFKDEGIVAVDACTAYSGFCNCYVIER
jgi:hypothetical protein